MLSEQNLLKVTQTVPNPNINNKFGTKVVGGHSRSIVSISYREFSKDSKGSNLTITIQMNGRKKGMNEYVKKEYKQGKLEREKHVTI